MGSHHLRIYLAIGIILGGLALVPALSQDGDRAERSPRRDRDPAEWRQRMEQMRARMMDRMRDQLGASADEWEVMKPRIEKVMQIQRDIGRGAFRFGGRGRDGRPGRRAAEPGDAAARDARPVPETVQKSRALRELLENIDADAEAINEALTELRTARQNAEAKLATARQELRDILTLRQEALLVIAGLLK